MLSLPSLCHTSYDRGWWLTPCRFKLKRPKVTKHYRDVLDQLYADVDKQDAGKLTAKL